MSGWIRSNRCAFSGSSPTRTGHGFARWTSGRGCIPRWSPTSARSRTCTRSRRREGRGSPLNSSTRCTTRRGARDCESSSPTFTRPTPRRGAGRNGPAGGRTAPSLATSWTSRDWGRTPCTCTRAATVPRSDCTARSRCDEPDRGFRGVTGAVCSRSPCLPGAPMSTWHRLGTRDELLARVPFSLKLERHQIAVFLHEGRFTAISNICNHRGGPLCEGRVRGEFVMCPWHGWEYSVVTGKGPAGYDEEQVPSFAVEERVDGVYVQTPPVMPRKLVEHKPSHLLEAHPKPAGAPPRVLGISTTAMDEANPRSSTSDALLDHAMEMARELAADTQLIRLRDLKFQHCEGNYSKASHACTWPCAITERDPEDQLTAVYEGLVHWADVVIISTPIRWGNASSLYYKMAERLNCVQNQITIHNNLLIKHKVAALIITGGQDNIQAVAGNMLTFWSELGFVFPQFPFIAHSRGWDAEDMQNNVRQVKASDALREASRELVERAVDFWKILDQNRAMMDRPMERAGRKANPLVNPQEAIV